VDTRAGERRALPYFTPEIRTKRGKEDFTRREKRRYRGEETREEEVRKPKVEEYRRKTSIRHDMQASRGDNLLSLPPPLSLSLSFSSTNLSFALEKGEREKE